jgi:hypothetical protein
MVCVKVEKVNACGGTPTVIAKNANMGFDWDHDKFIICTEQDLSLADHDHLAVMRKEAEDMAWTAYTVKNLQRENAKLKKLLKEQNEQLLN